jgi:hypothetical protein
MSDGTRVEIKSVLLHWPYGQEAANGSTHFRVGVQVLIGEVGNDAADSFDLTVCSPSTLAEIYAPEGWDAEEVLPGANVLPVTGLWLMKTWSEDDLRRALDRLIPAYSPGPDFATIAARMGRVIPWEYDYRFDDRQNKEAGLPPLHSFWHDEG